MNRLKYEMVANSILDLTRQNIITAKSTNNNVEKINILNFSIIYVGNKCLHFDLKYDDNNDYCIEYGTGTAT